MTVREQIEKRIADWDDAALTDLLEQMDRIERSRKRFPQEFFDMLNTVHERNEDISGEEALEIATEAVKAVRQSRN